MCYCEPCQTGFWTVFFFRLFLKGVWPFLKWNTDSGIISAPPLYFRGPITVVILVTNHTVEGVLLATTLNGVVSSLDRPPGHVPSLASVVGEVTNPIVFNLIAIPYQYQKNNITIQTVDFVDSPFSKCMMTITLVPICSSAITEIPKQLRRNSLSYHPCSVRFIFTENDDCFT